MSDSDTLREILFELKKISKSLERLEASADSIDAQMAPS